MRKGIHYPTKDDSTAFADSNHLFTEMFSSNCGQFDTVSLHGVPLNETV